MKNGFVAAGEKLLSRAAHALEHHPKQVTALVAALLLCGGGGAFAVASLDPDPSAVAVRQVLEAVESLPLQAQTQALDAHSFNLFRSDYTRANDTAEALLARLGVDDAVAAAYLRSEPRARAVLLGRAGRAVTAEASDDHALNRLTARWVPEDDGNFRRLVVERGTDGQFSLRTEVAPLVAAVRMGSATVRTSLFAAADEARIPDAVISQFVKIFSGDIDFHRALHSGDRFNVVYEALEADGEPIRTGRVLSVEFVNKGKLHQATWFQEQGGKGAYYTPDGKSLETSYLASPMEFSRVTSSFSMRFHPILHQWKAHLGTDYGAATGTPVRSVGDGVVEFAGVQNGFGKVVIVRHNNTDQTVYAHLSRINVRAGQRVNQGLNVGAVGSTGWATGPHLHFEYRVNGAHQPPQMMARRSVAEHLSAAARPEFDRVSRSMRVQLEAAASAGRFASAN
ncbi:MAG: peptidoglycan DD-metalloendopeptidase family protein [Ramlibacter sp.]|nr:M23 family metallopeptidase [Ramlibacter sp.]